MLLYVELVIVHGFVLSMFFMLSMMMLLLWLLNRIGAFPNQLRATSAEAR